MSILLGVSERGHGSLKRAESHQPAERRARRSSLSPAQPSGSPSHLHVKRKWWILANYVFAGAVSLASPHPLSSQPIPICSCSPTWTCNGHLRPDRPTRSRDSPRSPPTPRLVSSSGKQHLSSFTFTQLLSKDFSLLCPGRGLRLHAQQNPPGTRDRRLPVGPKLELLPVFLFFAIPVFGTSH